VANHFPATPAVATAGLTYSVYIGGLSGNYNSFPSQTFTPITWDFARTDPVTQAVTYDYAGFDQDTFEAALVTFLDSLAAILAANLGLGPAAVQAGVVITRTWEYATAGGASFTAADMTMTYPVPGE
jgi:hypothetical protein